MKEVTASKLTKIQVDAFLECIDLVKNGYMQCFAVVHDNFWFFKYRHLTNGRNLVVKWIPDEYTISEGKEILKRCTADSIQ